MSRPITTGQRQQLRADLPQDLEQLKRTLACSRTALAGPDPEAALGYLARLGALVDEALARHHAAGQAGRVPVEPLRQPDRPRRTA